MVQASAAGCGEVKEAGLDASVFNTSINNLTDDADIAITQRPMTERTRAKVPNTVHVSVDNFLGSPKYSALIEGITATQV